MTRVWWYAAALLAMSARVDAQTTTTDSTRDASAIVVGDRIDLRSTPVDRRGARARCEGDVTALAGDTIVVSSMNASRLCPRWTYTPDVVAELRVARGDRGSRGKHALVGFAIGAAVGGALGFALFSSVSESVGGSSGCGSALCRSPVRSAAAELALAVGAYGGGIGAVIGALLPAGRRWATVPVPGPVRVAGMRVQPALRVGLGHASR